MHEGSYTASVLPAGFHPELLVSVEVGTTGKTLGCPLFVLATVPSSFILDRYQLQSLHNDGFLGFYDKGSDQTLIVTGEEDLEAPDKHVSGAAMLLLVDPGISDVSKHEEGSVYNIRIPLHMRYLKPAEVRWKDGKRMDVVEVNLQWPLVFYACNISPDSDSFGMESLVCPSSTLPSWQEYPVVSSKSLHFLRPSLLSSSTVDCPPFSLPSLSLSIPIGVLSDLPVVETGTFLAVWFGAAWILYCAFKVRYSKSTIKIE